MRYNHYAVRRRTDITLFGWLVLWVGFVAAGCASRDAGEQFVRSPAVDATLHGYLYPDGSEFRAGAVIIMEDAVFSTRMEADGAVALRAFGLTVPLDQAIDESIAFERDATVAATRTARTRPVLPADMRALLEMSTIQVQVSLSYIDGLFCAIAHSNNASARAEAKRWYASIRTKDRLKLTVLYFPAYVESGSLVLSVGAKASIDHAF